jgi:hypothetical protein
MFAASEKYETIALNIAAWDNSVYLPVFSAQDVCNTRVQLPHLRCGLLP